MPTVVHSGRAWEKHSLLAVILLTAMVYVFSSAGRGVIDYDEGYYAQAALNMAVHGDWVTPYANGVRFLEKPPLLYWVTAVSFRLFGVNEFALRLPTALAVVALVWIVILIGRRTAGERAAVIAGLVTAFCVGTCLFTRETLHDVWLVLFLALAMYAFLEWYLDPLRPLRHALLFYASAAGAFMCKSLIGIAFPVGIVVVFFLISRERPRLRTLHLWQGILLFLLITVPWHWLAAARNPGFLNFYFIGEQFLRFFGKREPPVIWSLPLLTFWSLLLVWLFPWTAFLPAAFAEMRKYKDRNRIILARLAVTWAAVILGFFSISGRLEHYAFPALPALSLLVGGVLGNAGERKSLLWAFRGLALLGILTLVLGAVAGIWLASDQGFRSHATGPSNRLDETDFSIMAEMPPAILTELLKPAAVTVLALALGFAAALRFETHHRRMPAVICLSAVMVIVCGMVQWSLRICEDLISSRKFGVAIAQEARLGDRLVVVGDYESANSLNFYQPLPVEVTGGVAYALIPGMKYPDAPRVVLSPEDFRAAWHSAGRVFVLVPEARSGEYAPGGTEILRVLHRVLVRNR
jgi:4-amino-4-deoxy-L-arabinose transferase-like glycosyltransferase